MFSVTLGLYVHAITTRLSVLQHGDLCSVNFTFKM